MTVSKNKNEILWIVLLLGWAAVQLYFFNQSGVKTGWDSQYYLLCAEDLLELDFPDGRGIWYISYIITIAAIRGLGFSVEAVIFFQIFLSFVALISVSKISSQISSNKNAGFVAAFLYVLWLPIHEWNVFLYTESIFTSFLIISFYLLLNIRNQKDLWLFLPIFIFTVLIRPTGFAFFVAALFFLILKVVDDEKLKPLRTKITLVFSFFCLILISVMLQSYELVNSYAKAEIIYPNITLGIVPPENLVIPKSKSIVILDFFSFVYYNPFYFLKISALKLFLFFGNIKPYFSLFHNLYIILFLYPVYYLAIQGYKRLQEPIKKFFLLFISIQGITVMLTTENWDGRFLIPVLPFIFLLASMGLNRISLSYRSWKL